MDSAQTPVTRLFQSRVAIIELTKKEDEGTKNSWATGLEQGPLYY